MKLIEFKGDRVVPGRNARIRQVLEEPKKASKGEAFATFCIVYFLVIVTVILVIVRSH